MELVGLVLIQCSWFPYKKGKSGSGYTHRGMESKETQEENGHLHTKEREMKRSILHGPGRNQIWTPPSRTFRFQTVRQ